MTILLLISAAVVATGLYMVATRSSAVHPALASDNTAVGLRDAAVDTLMTGTPVSPKTKIEWQMTPVEDLNAAEEMLDYLEANGIAERELIVLGNSCFAVRWR